ncbi:ASKHA domain-containing protein [Carboxydocella sp. ULO1]|uniref:ASKHA domain-containing protein n=1 Tax=Carboxydocella sp. ULO1 TaxID=1926599 RepID=UPI0009ABE138|nr:ASKHA domain-containing protein [Carboxydocella sp. ULO1]
MSKVKVSFLPDQVTVEVEQGTSLLKAAAVAGISIKSTCGGAGTCGKCLVQVKEGEVRVDSTRNLSPAQQKQGIVLGCQAFAISDVTVEVPADSRLRRHQVLIGELEQPDLRDFPFEPLLRTVTLDLTPPTLDDITVDSQRLLAALAVQGYQPVHLPLRLLQRLPEDLRTAMWKVDVIMTLTDCGWQVIAVEPNNPGKERFGLAVDIGTTTVVVSLHNLANGQTVARAGTYNLQAQYGDDVISRMIHATENKDGLTELQQAVVKTINDLIRQIEKETQINREDIYGLVAAGNTTMSQLFLGISPKYIRLEPYIPTISSVAAVDAAEIGVKIHPRGMVYLIPSVASYVGGDITAGVLATRLTDAEEITLFIDIGTNGEMVLGNRDWLVTCACSAGPAFEGGGITFGMRAMEGAIERVKIDSSTGEIEYKTVQDAKPIGICGSGLIELLGQLRRAGLIDRTGKFTDQVQTDRLRERDGEKEYVLAWAKDSGSGKDIVITESDIKNLIRSKGAVYAGVRSLLRAVDLPLEAIDRIFIAGGFGHYLSIPEAVEIGLLPDVERDKYAYVGNTSLKGAQLALLSVSAWHRARQIGEMMTYIELSAGNTFMDEYVSALFLPHTDLTQFPSVKG